MHYKRWKKRGGDPAVYVLHTYPSNAPETRKLRFDQKWKLAHNGCWIWTGNRGKPSAKYQYEYGLIVIDYKRIRAHRASWMLHRGEIPADKHVLHKCNNALCVNPGHLYLGDHAQNMDDMATSRRSAHLKLTPEQVRMIRASPLSSYRIAKDLGLNKTSVQAVRDFKTHKHVV